MLQCNIYTLPCRHQEIEVSVIEGKLILVLKTLVSTEASRLVKCSVLNSKQFNIK